MSGTVFIYRVRRNDGATVYVGKTANVENRWKQHRTTVPSAVTALGELMRRCGRENFTVETVDQCRREEGMALERAYMLAAMVRGEPLVNANPMISPPHGRMMSRFEWFPWPHAEFLRAQALSNIAHIRAIARRYAGSEVLQNRKDG